MSPPDKRPARRSDDPDSTAELPVLADPNLADQDAWIAPPPVRGTLVDEVLQAHETEIQLLRRELAHAARERAAYERQYHEAISDREEMRQQLTAAEARADDLARQLNDIERSVEERDVRIGELQLDLDDAAGTPAGAAGAATSAVAAAADDAPAGKLAREHDTELRALRSELEQLRWRAAAQSEALQSREVRRQVNESQWRELEADIDGRDARIRLLEQELASARAAARRAEAAPAVVAPAEVVMPAAGQPTAGQPVTGQVATEQPAAPLPATAQPALPLEAEPWPPPTGAGDAPAGPAEAPPAEQAAQPAAQPGRQAGDHGFAGARPAEARANDTGAFASTGDFSATGDFTAGKRSGQPTDEAPVRMLVRTDGETDIVHVLGRRTTIGRTPDNDLRINAEWISRHHAVLLQTQNGTVLEDLNSTNGVLVNGLRVARRQLEPGDVVVFGKSSFRFLVKPSGS